MKKIVQKVNKLFGLSILSNSNQLLDKIYIKKYGSEEKAKAVFEKIKESCSSEEEFQDKLCEKIKSDFNVLSIISSHFSNTNNLSSLTKNIAEFKENNPLEKVSEAELKEIYNLYENVLKPVYNEELGIVDEKSRDKFIKDISENFITLKQVRVELKCKDQRTFEKWLGLFFGEGYPEEMHKFSNRGIVNNGYLSLSEYVEIVAAFLLSYDEEKIDLAINSKEYSMRFEKGLMVSRGRLNKILSTYYARLKENIEDWSGRNYTDGKTIEKINESDKLPYSIASLIINDIRNNYLV